MYSKMIVNGYSMQREYYDKKLEYCPYGSCGVVFGKKPQVTMLKSYSTFVLALDSNGWLQCKGTYSATTRKHIGAFCKEYCGSNIYYTCKEIAEKGLAFNIHTGELKELTGSRDIYGFYTIND